MIECLRFQTLFIAIISLWTLIAVFWHIPARCSTPLEENTPLKENTPLEENSPLEEKVQIHKYKSPYERLGSRPTYYHDRFSANTNVAYHGLRIASGNQAVPTQDLHSLKWSIACCANPHFGARDHDFTLSDSGNVWNRAVTPMDVHKTMIFPCEAYRSSIADKAKLCELSARVETDAYFTPQCRRVHDTVSLNATVAHVLAFKADTSYPQVWVWKDGDAKKHKGSGVKVLNTEQLVAILREKGPKATLMVQEFVRPFLHHTLGRKVEFRQYIITTSCSPLRLYAGGTYLSHAPTPWVEEYKSHPCAQLNHAERPDGEGKCPSDTLTMDEKQPTFDDWVRQRNVPKGLVQTIRNNIDKSMRHMMLSVARTVEQGDFLQRMAKISDGSKRCFTYMRADIAIKPNSNDALVVELNEFPYLDHHVKGVREMQRRDAASLWTMLGVHPHSESNAKDYLLSPEQTKRLDRACASFKCTESEYQEMGHLLFEEKHRGSLRRLHPTSESIQIARTKYFQGLPRQQRFLNLFEAIIGV